MPNDVRPGDNLLFVRETRHADPTATHAPRTAGVQATGRIADIYDDIRRFSGVPYVSSLQRYLATLPGVLEWAWAGLRPAMASGVIPETGWRLASDVRVTPAVPVPPATLRRWGIDDAGLAAIRNIAANFVRVSPVNLVTGACLSRLLTGAAPSGPGFPPARGRRQRCCRPCQATLIPPHCRRRSVPC